MWYFKPEWEKTSPQLQWIATPAAGRDWIEVEPGSNLTVLFGGFHGLMMAESVLGAALYFCKAFQFPAISRKKRNGPASSCPNGSHLSIKRKVTLLGFGRIGQTIGRVFKSFGC